LVRPTHELQGCFDMSPRLGLLVLSLLFEANCLLRGFGNRLGAVCLKQLSGVVVDFGFSHGAMLLSLGA